MLEDGIRAIVRDELARLTNRTKEPDRWLSTAQVAEMTGLSVSFFEVGRSMGAPDHPPYSRVGRRVLYRLEDIQKWMEARS